MRKALVVDYGFWVRLLNKQSDISFFFFVFFLLLLLEGIVAFKDVLHKMVIVLAVFGPYGSLFTTIFVIRVPSARD